MSDEGLTAKEETQIAEDAAEAPQLIIPDGIPEASSRIEEPKAEPAPDAVNTPQQPGEEPLFTECAFLMFLTPEGHWAADTNLTRQVTSARPASFNDFFHAACTVKKDIEASEAAQRVLIGQQNMAQHLQQQLETANIAKQMGGPIGQGLMDLSQLKRR